MQKSFQLVREALMECGVPEEEIVAQADLRKDLDVDSTELVEVIASINSKAGMRIESKALKGVRTVGKLGALVEREEAGFEATA